MNDIYYPENNFEQYRSVPTECVIKGSVAAPEISIFIPTYKRADTIADTIASALEQVDSVPYEIVIVDNDPSGASGETRKKIAEYKDPRLYYYVNRQNIGLCGNWNRGLELCRGRYVAMIHDDDMLSPWFLSSVVRAIQENDHPFIIGVRSIDFTSRNKPHFSEPGRLDYRAVTKKSFFFGRYLTIAGMTVDREKAIALGGYHEAYYPNEDTIFIYQALLRGSVINVNNDLAGYRKEVNLSLSDGTMKKIIEYTELTRRCIAQHEGFAERFMKYFDREYLYSYAADANESWGTNVSVDEIMQEFDLVAGKPAAAKMKLMNLFVKLGRL